MIEVLASESHYLDHLGPIIHELRRRGREVKVLVVGAEAELRAMELELHAQRGVPRAPDGPPVLVASARDYGWTSKSRRIAYVEHGAGQTYVDNVAPGYAGALDMDMLDLVLTPGPHATRIWERAYPALRVEAVGAPKLDGLIKLKPSDGQVAVTFHWLCRRSQEAGTAWFEWRDALTEYAGGNSSVLGHWHPKWNGVIERWWKHMGVATTRSSARVLAACDLLVADNTTLLYEFAALGKPVLCLNSGRWRKDVQHGLRFWDFVPGLQLDPGADLRAGIDEAMRDSTLLRSFRERATAEVYGDTLDGRAGERAADVLEEWAWTS